MKVHALDGDPHYARRDQHAVPISVLGAVVAYNAAAASNERFDGIHFDNEPYILLDWREPRLREQLLEEYLELNARAAAAAHDAGLAYGVDIPFWWDVAGERAIGAGADAPAPIAPVERYFFVIIAVADDGTAVSVPPPKLSNLALSALSNHSPT